MLYYRVNHSRLGLFRYIMLKLNIKITKFALHFLLLFLFLFSLQCRADMVYNVKNFGAIGDGKIDDILAFERCFAAALKNTKSRVVIPYGKYKISRTLMIDFLKQEIEVVGLMNALNHVPEIVLNKNETVMHVKGWLFDVSKGVFKISNLSLKANNPAYSSSHPRINNNRWSAGLLITDKSDVFISNIKVSNVYGTGIYVATTVQEQILRSARFKYLEISNCSVENVWGYNPSLDNYGDGIYVSNVASGSITKNTIFNNVSITKQLGRAGIVLEYMDEGIRLSGNSVLGGYDRALHIEKTYGGHNIVNNKFLGSDMSLIVYEPVISNDFKIINFEKNVFSNKNMDKKLQFNKVYGKDSYGDRSLLNLLTSGKSIGKKIVFNNNEITVDERFVYESNAIVNNRSVSTKFSNNQYKIINNIGKRKLGIYNYSNTNMLNDLLLDGIQIFNFDQ